MTRLDRTYIVALVFLGVSAAHAVACAGSDTGDATGGTTGSPLAGSSGSAAQPSCPVGEPTCTAAPMDVPAMQQPPTTTTDAAAATDTTDRPTCSWHWPELHGLRFCPHPTTGSADIAGDTPYGPVTLKHAYFGLFQCAPCPTANRPSIGLYAAPEGPDDTQGDFIAFPTGIYYGPGRRPDDIRSYEIWGRVAGQSVEWELAPATDISFRGIEPPTIAETSPPLDADAPPILAGTVSITSGGWQVEGSFTASLCTDLDWTPPCE